MYSKQHKRKALLTRISSILLSATIAFTSLPVTNVYAEEKVNIEDKTGNGGDKQVEGSKNQAETLDGSLYGRDFSQGLRFYLVNENLERISECYNFLFDDSFVKYTYKAAYNETRFDTADSPQNPEYYGMDTLKEWCTIPQTTDYQDPAPALVGLSVTGKQFRDWYLNGIEMSGGGLLNYGSANANNSSGSTTGTGSTSQGVNKEITEEHPVVDKPTDKIELGDSLYDGDFDYSDVIDYYGIEVKPVASGITSDIAGIGQQKAYEQAYKTALLEAEQKAKKVAMSIRDKLKATYNEKVKYYGNNYRSMSLNECKLAALADIKGNVNNATSCETVKTIAYRYLYNYCSLNETDIYTVSSSSTALYINNNSDLLSTNIPLANEDFSNVTQLQANSRAFCMLNKSDTIVIHDKATYGENAAIALSRHNCLVVVEPIFIYKNMRQKGIYNYQQSCLAKHYDSKYSIGSVWNAIREWDGSEISTYSTFIADLLPNSFVTTKQYDLPSGKSILPVTPNIIDGTEVFYTDKAKRMSGLRKEMNTLAEAGGQSLEGIAMHAYSASDIFSDSSTSTYDETLQSTIGPSESCDSLPAETDLGNLSKTVNILKVYTTLKADGSEVVDGAFLRTKTPHQIAIESEPDYSVVKWETSAEKTTLITEAQNGTKQYNYEQFTTNSTKNQSGTTENNITLSINEYTLYVKLQKQETPPPSNTRLTGDYILNESELAKAFQITPISIEYTFPKISFTENKPCGNHYNHRDTDGDGIDDDYDTCGGASSSSGYISDSKATVTIKNEAESSYSNIIVQSDKAKFKSDMTVAELNRGTNADSFNTSANHKYTFNVYRYQQGEQNLTLCKYWQKQSSNKDVSVGTTQTIAAGNKDIAKTLGYSEANSKSTKSRAEIDYIVNAVKFKFIYDKANSPDKSTSYYLHGDNCSCGGVHVGGYSRGKDIDTATTVESEADISVQVYSGTSNKQLHTKLWTETIGRNGEKYLPIRDNNNKTVGRQVQSTSTVKFNPFM